MPSGSSNWWYCCSGCASKLAPFSGVLKELRSHRTSESRCLLIRGNGGLTNVNFEEGESIDQDPTWLTSGTLQDEGRTSDTHLASLHCSNCSNRVGWKIIYEFSNHPTFRPGQYILQIDPRNENIYWHRPRPGRT